jgi:hypothetical protein
MKKIRFVILFCKGKKCAKLYKNKRRNKIKAYPHKQLTDTPIHLQKMKTIIL